MHFKLGVMNYVNRNKNHIFEIIKTTLNILIHLLKINMNHKRQTLNDNVTTTIKTGSIL